MNATRVSRLRYLAFAAPIAITAALGVSATAQAATGTTVLPGSVFCGFDVTQNVLIDDTKTTTLSDGTTVTAGHYVVQFSANGKSKTFDASGPELSSVKGTTETDVFIGPSTFLIGPKGRANTGAPAISYSPGITVVQADLSQTPPVVTKFTPTLPVTDICKLLA